MKQIHTILFVLFLGLFSGVAQYKIAGIIQDAQNQTLPYANVLLYTANSSQTPKGVVSDERGSYQFENIATGTYYIEVSMLGLKTKKGQQFVLDADKNFDFVLEEESQSLDEVVIKSRRPVIKQTAEKLIIDLQNSEMVSSNLQDVIKRVPGVIATNNGISVAGRNDVRILINGKTTEYMDVNTLLRDLPADNIASVELIEQPGAEYDAEGSGPIINIVLKKNVQLGTHGNITAWAGDDNGFEYGTSASIASYKNKLNWQLSTGYSSPTWREDLYVRNTVADTLYNRNSVAPYNPKTFRLGGSFDYFLTKNHTLGMSVSRNETDSERVAAHRILATYPGGSYDLLTENDFNRQRIVFTLNPYYEFKDDKNTVTADFNYVDYTNDNINDLYKVGGTSAFTNLRYDQEGMYQIKTYRLDYKRVLSDKVTLRTGMKFADVETDSDLNVFVQRDSGDFDLLSDASNRFLVDETILAFYTKVQANLGKWTLSTGLRYEDSDTKGTASATNETRSREISDFFPSASITRKLSQALGAGLSYSYRLQRPNYSTLNSFTTFYDPLTAIVGNPNLAPAFTHNYQFNLTFEGQPFFTIGHSQTKDAFFDIIFQEEDSAQSQEQTINLSDRTNWNFRLFGPLNFVKGLEGYTGAIVNYNNYESERLTPKLELEKWNLIWFIQASYQLPWDVNFEFSGNYGTGTIEGMLDVDWFADLDFSFGKKFMDNKLKVNLGFNSMINRPFVADINYDNLQAHVESNQSRYNVQLRATYSFGSKFSKSKTRRNASEDEQNRIEDNN